MKRAISLLMSFVMLFSVISGVNLSAYAKESATSGKCGENVYWSYDEGSKTLTISGTGEMDDYYENEPYVHIDTPWRYCSPIENLNILNGVTSIGDYAFYRLSVTDVIIPDSVKSIGYYAFFGSALSNISIPNSVDLIEEFAFVNCKNLSTISVAKDNKSFSSIDGVLFDKSLSRLIKYPCSNKKAEYVIPESVTAIASRAFGDCTNIKKLTLSNNIKSIGEFAFYNCCNLTSIIIPKDVQFIETGIFDDCDNLCEIYVDIFNKNYSSKCGILFNKDYSALIKYPQKKLDTEYIIPNTVRNICNYAFGGCTNLTSIKIPDSVTSIGDQAFKNCTNLTKVKIPDSVTSIGNAAFDSCKSITSAIIGNSVTSIGDYAFDYCSNLESITIPYSVTSIGDYAFDYCSNLESITIPYSVINIGDYAFRNCTNLTNITIPDSVTYLGEGAFSLCENLKSIVIGNGITKIYNSVFVGCSSLTSVIISKNVISIEFWALAGCTNLKSVEIPDSLKNIDDAAFSDCKNLTDVYYTGDEEQWKRISIDDNNECLTNATIHYNSSLPDQPETPDRPDSTKLKPQSFKVVNKPYEGKYGFYYTDDYFKKPATKYNQSLATMSLCLALSTYQDEDEKIYDKNVKNVKNLFGKCGFVVDGVDSTFQQKNYDIKTGTDTIACSFASKKIGDSTLVAVAVRSGGYGAEWASNLTLGLSGDHAGFDDASSKVYEYLADYVNSRNITGKVKFWITGFSRGGATANLLAAKLDNTIDSHPKITYSKEDVYAYTFATPAGAVKSNKPHSKKYNNIFNIINFHDLVPLVAPSQTGWSFDRYGITKVLPFSESTSVSAIYEPKMIKYLNGMGYEYKVNNFKSYINFGYGPVVQKNNYDTLGVFNRKFIKSVANQIGGRYLYVLNYQNKLRNFASKNGWKIYAGLLDMDTYRDFFILLYGEGTWHPHLTATAIKNFDLLTVVHAENANYLAWMMCMDKNYDPSNHEYFTNGDYRVVKVNCPVDVNVYDESNNLVASIINDVPQQIDGSTIISSIDENEQKVVYLPVDGEYRVEVKAREDCQTTYSVNEYTGFSSDLSKVVAYQDVNMKKNETLISNVDSYTNEEISDEEGTTNGSSVDYNLELNNKELAPEVNATGEEIKNVTYTVNVSYDENQGAASAGGEFTAGDFCLLTVTAKEGFAFDGWYIDGKKVSSDASYRFAVKSNVNVEAKFKSVETGGGSTDPTPTPGGGGGGGAIPAPIPDETDKKDDNKKPETKPNQSQNTSTSATQKLRVKKLVSKRKALVVYWNKIADVSGYQIQVATDKKFKKNKKTVTVAKQNASKKTVKKLKAKKKYFVRVRAYKTVNGKKSYGKWSKIKTVKTK